MHDVNNCKTSREANFWSKNLSQLDSPVVYNCLIVLCVSSVIKAVAGAGYSGSQ